MINLRVRSEYSFRYAYGKLDDVIQAQGDIACLTDRGNTFGHVPFIKKCKELGKKPILGAELLFCENAKLKVRYNLYPVTLLAKNLRGLKEINGLVSEATKNKYYEENRNSFDQLSEISDNVIIIIEDSFLQKYNKNAYYAVTPLTNYGDFKRSKLPFVAMSDNLYCKEGDKKFYEIITAKGVSKNNFIHCQDRLEPSHILSEKEWKDSILFLNEEDKKKAINLSYKIAKDLIEYFDLPKAKLPDVGIEKTLRELCEEGAKKRKIKLEESYLIRLDHELDIIRRKNFENYFFIVYDIVNFAKKHMLVGPGRGSSAGSLVCYLLEITEIDPLKYDLLFERFIDINRNDLPDIDIDFQDDKRFLIFDYAFGKYGKSNSSKLATVSKYKPRATLVDVCKVLGIKEWQIESLRECFPKTDPTYVYTFEKVFSEKIGQEYLKKYPALENCLEIEGIIRQQGKHSAGLILSGDVLTNYVAFDYSTQSCQIDKNNAEYVNLLKVDILGLSNLRIIKNCLDEIGKDREWLLNLPLDDKKAFDVLNNKKYVGIFQFEGKALISVAENMIIEEFNDLVAITSLARPGTLGSGESTRYLHCRETGNIEYSHPILEKYLKETQGIIIYQEQIMKIVREIGNFSWEDTSKIRKAIGKSKGANYINEMKPIFLKGCKENNVDVDSAETIWSNILAMGSYTFNKSHAVSYSLLSYWCMYLKAHYQKEFSLAILQNQENEDKNLLLLRELVKDGYKYKPYDCELSEVNWCFRNNTFIGGFTNIKGVGDKKAEIFIRKRKTGEKLTAVQRRLLYNSETPYDYLYEFKEKMGGFYKFWNVFVKKKPVLIQDIKEGETVRFLCKSIEVKRKDVNNSYFLQKRNGQVLETGNMNLVDLILGDDTGTIRARIPREDYFVHHSKNSLSGMTVSKHKEGTYYIVKATCCSDFKFLFIDHIIKTSPEQINKKLGIDI